jgi:hypothetical protein
MKPYQYNILSILWGIIACVPLTLFVGIINIVVCFYRFWESVILSMENYSYHYNNPQKKEQTKQEEESIWDKHIKRMEEKKQGTFKNTEVYNNTQDN